MIYTHRILAFGAIYETDEPVPDPRYGGYNVKNYRPLRKKDGCDMGMGSFPGGSRVFALVGGTP